MPSPTPLQRDLANGSGSAAARPLDAFRLARNAFLGGEKIEMQALAAELGVNRATLYRWVGSRELLLGQVISSLSEATMRRAAAEAEGRGADYLADAIERGLRYINEFEPMRRFLERDPQYALRVLTSKESSVQRTTIDQIRELLAEQQRIGAFDPPTDIDDLSYVIVRISESFLYSDVILGDEPDVAKAALMIRLLLGATPARPR